MLWILNDNVSMQIYQLQQMCHCGWRCWEYGELHMFGDMGIPDISIPSFHFCCEQKSVLKMNYF